MSSIRVRLLGFTFENSKMMNVLSGSRKMAGGKGQLEDPSQVGGLGCGGLSPLTGQRLPALE